MGAGLASEGKGGVSFSQVRLYGKSRHFVYVRALINTGESP